MGCAVFIILSVADHVVAGIIYSVVSGDICGASGDIASIVSGDNSGASGAIAGSVAGENFAFFWCYCW